MYCSQCGSQLNENGICPSCTANVPRSTTNSTPLPAVTSDTSYEFSPVKPLRSCAWFGPVAVVLSGILNTIVVSGIYNSISDRFPEIHSFGTIEAALFYFFYSILSFTCNLPVYYGLSAIALLKQPATFRKASFTSFMIPWATFSVASTICTPFPYVISYIASDGNALTVDAIKAFTFSQAAMTIATGIISAVLSYFLLSKYFGNLQQTLHTAEFEQTKAPAYTSTVSTNAAPQSAATPTYVRTFSSKSKAAAALLCFFLGFLGVHRFYAGKVGTGILWLLTGGLFGIGSFVDFFVILFGKFKDSENRPIT